MRPAFAVLLLSTVPVAFAVGAWLVLADAGSQDESSESHVAPSPSPSPARADSSRARRRAERREGLPPGTRDAMEARTVSDTNGEKR